MLDGTTDQIIAVENAVGGEDSAGYCGVAEAFENGGGVFVVVRR